MTNSRIPVVGAILLASVCLARAADVPASQPGAIDIDNPPPGVFSDEWYVLMLSGQKSGHMHITMERTKQSGRDVIRTGTTMAIEIGRAETPIKLTFEQSTDETLTGQPLSFKNRMLLGKFPSTTTGTIDAGKVTIVTSQLGITTDRQEYDLPKGAIMSWGTYREQIRRGLHPGLKYELSVYEPSISADRLTPTTMEVYQQETLDLFGRKTEAFRTKQTASIKSPLLGGKTDVETTTWMTDAGTVVKMQMTVPPIDMPFEVIACPKSVALARNDPAELMVNTLIHVNRELDGRHAKSITYRIVGKGGGDVRLPQTPMQQIVENKNGVITLKLTRRSARHGPTDSSPARADSSPAPDTGGQAASGTTDSSLAPHPSPLTPHPSPLASHPSPLAPRPSPLTTHPSPLFFAPHPSPLTFDDDLKQCLRATSDMNYKDPKVAELAKKAAGDEKDPAKLAAKLCRFVHEYIQTKNLSVGFATASEVARSREGDCTEHGVLLATLGRACGIPTRIVTGIVYTDDFAGEKNVFVGHLWTQFWLGGEWVDVDAAFNQTDVDPTHIALGLSSGSDTGMADLVASGWLSLGKIVLKVVEVQ